MAVIDLAQQIDLSILFCPPVACNLPAAGSAPAAWSGGKGSGAMQKKNRMLLLARMADRKKREMHFDEVKHIPF
jgi:hypothetical protein